MGHQWLSSRTKVVRKTAIPVSKSDIVVEIENANRFLQLTGNQCLNHQWKTKLDEMLSTSNSNIWNGKSIQHSITFKKRYFVFKREKKTANFGGSIGTSRSVSYNRKALDVWSDLGSRRCSTPLLGTKRGWFCKIISELEPLPMSEMVTFIVTAWEGLYGWSLLFVK